MNYMLETYILDSDRARELLKGTLEGQWSLYRRVSAQIGPDMGGVNGKDPAQIINDVATSVISDLVRHIARSFVRKDDDIPFTGEYPEMVLYEIVRRVGPLNVSMENKTDGGEYVRVMNIPLRNQVWRIAYRHGELYSLEWGDDNGYNHVWNVLSYGWSNFYGGTRRVCMNPDRAAGLILMMDDMAGFLNDELSRLYQKVKRDRICRRVRQITSEAIGE